VSPSPERWLVLSVRPASAESAPLVAEELIELGGTALYEQDGALVTWLAPPEDEDDLLDELRLRLAEVLPPGEAPEIEAHWQEDEDWAASWRRGLGPRKVSKRIVVKPTWTEWSAAPGEIVVDIDPQMAFGTGEHATTRGSLRLLDQVIREGDRVLDVGSGSGILAIAAARLGAQRVIAIEYDPDANLNARENLEQNGVADKVQILEEMADSELLATLGRFDVVVANILSGVIRPLLPAFRRALAPGGRLIVSGIMGDESADVVRDAEAAGFHVAAVDEEPEEEWWSALLLPEQ
jgi:ribosomal protein L11 methyltransferase